MKAVYMALVMCGCRKFTKESEELCGTVNSVGVCRCFSPVLMVLTEGIVTEMWEVH